MTQEKKVYALEIEYVYKKSKDDPEETSWAYYWHESVKIETAITNAKKYFKELVESSGWTKQVSKVKIHEMLDGQTSQSKNVVVVSDDVLTPARTKGGTNTTTDGDTKPTTPTKAKPKRSASVARKTTTTAVKRAPRKPKSTTP